MMRLRHLLATLAMIASCAPAFAEPRRPAVVAIVGADILPMTKQERLRDQTVIVRGDRIVQVGPRSAVKLPRNARRIDARGLVLMPGLVDMHVHLPSASMPLRADLQQAFDLMIANGVTTARAMQGPAEALEARDAIERGTIVGPRLYVASPIINDDNASSPEAARDAVRAAARRRYDLIKAHQIGNLETWRSLIDEAAGQAMPVAGHVDNGIGLPRALAAAQEVEHLDGALFELLPENSAERRVKFAQIPPAAIVAASTRTGPTAIEHLARQVAVAGSYQVPTLSSFESFFSPESALQARIERAEAHHRLPSKLVRAWIENNKELRGLMTPDAAAAFLRLRRSIAAAYARAGVKVMAGSDTPQPFHLWGEGLVREIEALAAAGLTPMQALRSATVVPRDYFRSLGNGGSALGWKADFGTVEAGARADLLLLAGDPSQNLKALQSIRLVIASGRVHDRAALDALLASEAKLEMMPVAN